MLTRRNFIGMGLSAGALGCVSRMPGDTGEVRFGVLSDTHVTGPESIPEMVRVFTFLRDKGVDAVIHCGDMTDLGYIAQLESLAEAWRKTMPPDMPFLPVLGNRDVSATGKISPERRKADHALLLRSAPLEHVRRILGIDVEDGLRVRQVKDVPVVLADWGHEKGLEAFMLRHPELRDPARPFVQVQHPHPGGTIYGGSSDDPVTCWLNMFPRAFSLSGHSHLPFTDRRTFRRNYFTAAAGGSYYLSGGPAQKGIREASVLVVGRTGLRLERYRLHEGTSEVLTADFPPPQPPDSAVAGSFVFAQWNVGGFCLGQDGAEGGRTGARAEAFRRQIAELGADFIGLCEYAPAFAMDGVRASKAAFGSFKHVAAGPRLGANGNAIASVAHPLAAPCVYDFSQRKQQRYCIVCETEIAGAATTIVETHLDLDETTRRAQLAALLDRFGDRSHLIVSGDFNVSGPKEFAPFLDAGFRMANCSTLGALRTHRRRKSSYSPAIDNLLVKGFDVVSVRTADDSMLLSDHRILVCRLVRSDGAYSPAKSGVEK